MLKNLENLGVKELNNKEIKETEGGLMISVAVCLFALGVSIGLLIGSGKP